MPLNLQGFVTEPNQWAGLYHAADQMEKRQLKQEQLAAQQQAKRATAGQFLQNYLDPKDYLSGTHFDPMVLQGLQEAMQQGIQLVNAGADSPMLMMALGPMVNKLNTYTTNAKNINKQVDDQIARMKADGYVGYDYSKLKDVALKNAFYRQDANGQSRLDPDQADPTVNWVDKALENNPELVTTSRGWDQYADKAQLKTETHGVEDYDRFGTKDLVNVNMKFQDYMVPEWEGKKVKGFVPKYQMATDGGQPIMHDFTDAAGQRVKAPVRLLDKAHYEGLPQDLKNDIRGKLKMHLKEYRTATGQEIAPNSPQAELVGRGIAYDELNRPQRNRGSFGDKVIENKPSPQMVNLNIRGTDQYLNTEQKIAEMKATVKDAHRPLKSNPVETIGDIFNLNLESQNVPELIPNGGGKSGIDVTDAFQGGGLKSGRGDGFNYKKIYFDPTTRSLTLEREAKQSIYGKKAKSLETIPEKDIGKFMYRIGRINNMSNDQIKKLMNKMGYDGTVFKGGLEKKYKAMLDQREQNIKTWNATLWKGPEFGNTNQ